MSFRASIWPHARIHPIPSTYLTFSTTYPSRTQAKGRFSKRSFPNAYDLDENEPLSVLFAVGASNAPVTIGTAALNTECSLKEMGSTQKLDCREPEEPAPATTR